MRPPGEISAGFSWGIGNGRLIMTSFTQTKATLDEIASLSEGYRKKLEQAKAAINSASVGLNGMGSAYSAFIAQLDIDAATNSTDAAWIAAKAEKDQMVADFLALKATAAALLVAVNS